MVEHVVKCRYCGKSIDINKEIPDVDWVMPANRYYYHKACYDKKNLRIDSEITEDEFWYDNLRIYLTYELMLPKADWGKIRSQWNTYLKQKKTSKGIYFAVKYFYDVRNGDKNRAVGGIGIVPTIYNDSCYYWAEKLANDKEICRKIEEQITERYGRNVRIVKSKKEKNKKNKPKYILSEI